MRNYLLILLFVFITDGLFSSNYYHGKDSSHISPKIDTNYIQDYHDWLNIKLIGVMRDNKFSIKDNVSQSILEYGINTNVNSGLGLTFRGIGVDFEFNPPGLNNDDHKYGKSTQLSFSTSANSRRFIYDVYYRYNQGFHTTIEYKIPNDTTGVTFPIYRPDIKNTLIGLNLVYIFNNKRFSSSAPYNLTQRQKKSAGSVLLGTFVSLYAINADSVIFPDTLKKNFNPSVQFKDAGSITYGLSFGYTYTFVFFRNWFLNLYTLPGLSFQQYYSTNAYNQQTHTKFAAGLSLQSRFSIGYNRSNYFIGISYMENNYFVNNDKKSSFDYKLSSFRLYYGHRFDLHRVRRSSIIFKKNRFIH